ncbi:hypothetical protein Q2941_47210 [Bradyrhizobium sp. UFLA05-153]
MPHKTDSENGVIELTDQLDRENEEHQLNTVSGGAVAQAGWNLARNKKAA